MPVETEAVGAGYRSLGGRNAAIQSLTIAALIFGALALWFKGSFYWRAETASIEWQMAAKAMLQVAWAMWFYRAAANLAAFGVIRGWVRYLAILFIGIDFWSALIPWVVTPLFQSLVDAPGFIRHAVVLTYQAAVAVTFMGSLFVAPYLIYKVHTLSVALLPHAAKIAVGGQAVLFGCLSYAAFMLASSKLKTEAALFGAMASWMVRTIARDVTVAQERRARRLGYSDADVHELDRSSRPFLYRFRTLVRWAITAVLWAAILLSVWMDIPIIKRWFTQ